MKRVSGVVAAIAVVALLATFGEARAQGLLSVVVTPATGIDTIGSTHTVTATVTDDSGSAAAGATVVFAVTGANVGATCVGGNIQTTGTDGTAQCSYVGDLTGDDTISAAATVLDDNGNVVATGSGSASETWVSGISVAKSVTSASKDVRTLYTWSALDKSVSPTTTSLNPGQSTSVTYTISGTRSQSSQTTTYTVSGDITVTNDSGEAQQVTVVDQAQTSAGSPRGGAFTHTTTVAANSTATIPYVVTFTPGAGDTSSTTYRNHVDVFAGSATSGTALASADANIADVTSTTSSTGSSAIIDDAITCPNGFTCGAPTSFSGDGTAPPNGSGGIRQVDGTFTFSYQRLITNNSVCGTSTVITDNATLTAGGSPQLPLTDSATVTNTAGPCLSATKTATATRTITKTYDWTLQKSASPPAAALPAGSSTTINYSLVAARTLVSQSDVIEVTGTICVTNGTGAATSGLMIVDQIEQQSGGGYVPVPGASQTITPANQIPAGGQQCYAYDISFAAPADLTSPFRNHATITSGTNTAQATAPFTVPAPLTVEHDATASIDDAASCPPGYTCGTPSVTFPRTVTANTTIPYTRSITNNSACGAPATLGNTATLTEADSQQARSASAIVTLTPGPCGADMSLTKTASPTTTQPGKTVTFTLVATNRGPLTATGVKVTDPLPARTTLVSATASQGGCATASGVVTCSLGTLAPGASATVRIVVKVLGQPRTVQNTASVTADESDPDQSNNSASATVRVVP